MNVDKIYERISLNNEIPEFEKKLISESFNLKKYRKGDIIITDKEDCNILFFVLKGALRIFYFNRQATEVTRTFIFENEFCTNLISFSKQAKNNENIQCLEDTILFCISRENFFDMLNKSHVLTKLYSKILEHFIHLHLQHFQFINTLNQRQRVEKFLQESPEINRRVKDKIIATYLGVTPEFFSRTKSKFYQHKK